MMEGMQAGGEDTCADCGGFIAPGDATAERWGSRFHVMCEAKNHTQSDTEGVRSIHDQVSDHAMGCITLPIEMGALRYAQRHADEHQVTIEDVLKPSFRRADSFGEAVSAESPPKTAMLELNVFGWTVCLEVRR